MDYMDEEDDDYHDDDDGGGEARGSRRKKLLQGIRKRMSIVGTPSTRIGRRGVNDDDDDDDDDDSRGSEDEHDFYGIVGFLKRKNNNNKENQQPGGGGGGGNKRRSSIMMRMSSKQHSPQPKDSSSKKSKRLDLASTKAKHNKKRKSIHQSHGSLSRVSASRSLRASIRQSLLLRKSSKDEDDEELDDVAMPLPPGSSVAFIRNAVNRRLDNNNNNGPMIPEDDEDDDYDEDNNGKKKKRTKKKKKTTIGKKGNKNDDKSKLKTPNGSSNTNSKKRPLGMIKDALSISIGSGRGSGRGSPSRGKIGRHIRRRRRKSGDSDDRSVDSPPPPSVGSTEFSVDGARQQPGARQGSSGLGGLPRSLALPFVGKRGPDDETGANFEAMSLDYYYQSVPWIIKNWIYFLTVLVPFSCLYVCFVGIFHSTTLHQNIVLRKVAISNMLFVGLGCTFRSNFKARQMLDNRGVNSALTAKRYNNQNLNRTGSNHIKDGSSNNKKYARQRTQRRHHNNRPGPGSSFGSVALRIPRVVRRRTMDMGSVTLGTLSKSLLPSSSDHQMQHTNRRQMRSSSIGGNPSMMNISSSNNIYNSNTSATSMWDIERMLPGSNKSQEKPTKARPSIDKHNSIMEIYEVHANDEKVSILQ